MFFAKEDDVVHYVHTKGLWRIHNHLAVFLQWRMSSECTNEEFNILDYWIPIHKLPPLA